MKRPCYGCLNRKVGCHSICDAYLKFEAKNKKQRDERFARTSALTNPVLREAGTEKLRKRALMTINEYKSENELTNGQLADLLDVSESSIEKYLMGDATLVWMGSMML